METQRAYAGADTAITLWVRDEAGKRDFTGEELTVSLYAYGVPSVLTTVPATSAEDGKVEWEVSQSLTDTYLAPGVYRYAVTADGAFAAGGLLEVV